MKKTSNKLKILIETGVSFILLIATGIILITILYPNYQQTRRYIDEAKNIQKEIDQYRVKYTKITAFTPKQLAQLYSDSKKALPEDINVGDMGEYINEIASQYNLNVVRLTISEESNFQFEISSLTNTEIPLRRISIPFVIKGKKENLLTFLDDIQDALQHTEFNRIQLTETQEGWVLRLTLLSYYLPYVQTLPITYKLPDIIPD